MNLIQYHGSAGYLPEKMLRILQSPLIAWKITVEILRAVPMFRQCGFPDPAHAGQPHN
jgi:hypothetical protein